MNNYQGMSGLELFGDPFSHNSYSQATTQSGTTATQPKTPVQQSRTQVPTTQPEPVKTQVQQSQSTTNSVTQAKTPVLQQNPSTPAPEPAPEPKPVTSVSAQEPAPADVKPQSEPPKKELVMDMSSDTSSKSAIDDTAKRKAAWEEKQRAKKQAEEEALRKLQDMSDDDVIAASTKRISTDVERLTRRNMKECVAAHIQELARKDAAFARKTMHPRKNMVNCFRYINRMAKDYVKQEMEDNDIKPENGIYGTDVPDNILYRWSERYFYETDLPEDGEKGEKEEKFVPKPYVGTTSSKTSSKPKKAASKAKKAEKPATNEAKKKPEPKSSDYQQMSLF